MPKIQILSKKEAVYDWLRESILRGEIQPGEQITIDDIATNLGVSQIPVREALQQLKAEGFVDLKPYSKVTVTELHPGVLTEVFAMLETAQVVSGRQACLSICREELAQLEALLLEMDEYLEDVNHWSAANVQFHKLVCACAGTGLIQNILENLLNHWDRLRRHYVHEVFAQRVAIAQRDHWALFAALQDRDPDRFEKITRSHNRQALQAYIAYLQDQGFPDLALQTEEDHRQT